MNGIKFFLDTLIKEKELIKNSGMVLVSNSAASILLFLANLFLSKIFGPTLFGTYKTLLYFMFLLGSLMDLGMSFSIPKYVAELKEKNRNKIPYLIKWFLKLRICSFMAMIVLVFLLRNQIASWFLHDISLSYLVIIGISLIIANFTMFLRYLVIGFENFKAYSLSNIIEKVIYITVGVLFGYFLGVKFALIGYALSIIISNIAILGLLNKDLKFGKQEKIDTKKIFWSYSIKMHLLNIPNILGTSIVPLLSLFFSTEVMGYYSFAFMFYFASLLVPSSLSNVLFPKVSRLNGKKGNKAKESLKRVLLIYTLFLIVGVAGVLLFSGLFIRIVAYEYLAGVALFKIILTVGLFLGYGTIMTSYYGAKAKIDKVAVVVFIQNALLFIVSFVALLVIF